MGARRLVEAIVFATRAIQTGDYDATTVFVCREHADDLRRMGQIVRERTISTRGISCQMCRAAWQTIVRESGR